MTPSTGAPQAPPSMEFSKQEYCSGQPFLSPGDLLDSRIKPRFPALQADSLLSEPPGKPAASSAWLWENNHSELTLIVKGSDYPYLKESYKDCVT